MSEIIEIRKWAVEALLHADPNAATMVDTLIRDAGQLAWFVAEGGQSQWKVKVEYTTKDDADLPDDTPVDGTPIDEAGLNNRALNALRKNGITTVEQLSQITYNELSRMDGIGTAALNHIAEVCTLADAPATADQSEADLEAAATVEFDDDLEDITEGEAPAEPEVQEEEAEEEVIDESTVEQAKTLLREIMNDARFGAAQAKNAVKKFSDNGGHALSSVDPKKLPALIKHCRDMLNAETDEPEVEEEDDELFG